LGNLLLVFGIDLFRVEPRYAQNQDIATWPKTEDFGHAGFLNENSGFIEFVKQIFQEVFGRPVFQRDFLRQ
jgi:hypothetical protein